MLYLLLLFAYQAEPMNVSLNDKVINLSVQSIDQQIHNLEDILDSGFVIFLSLNCQECQKAILTYQDYFFDNQQSVLLIPLSQKKWQSNSYLTIIKTFSSLNLKI